VHWVAGADNLIIRDAILVTGANGLVVGATCQVVEGGCSACPITILVTKFAISAANVCN